MNNSRKKNESLIDWIHEYDIDPINRVIFLHSQEYADDGWSENGVEYKMANKFIKNLHHLNSLSKEPIDVYMASCGGCWNFGMAIYDAIKQSESPVDIYAYAHARSMTSIIFQAARHRYISKHCHFMIHYGDYGDYGDLTRVISGMEFYKKSNKIMLDIYSEKCENGDFFKKLKLDKNGISKYLDNKMKQTGDFWLDSEEAVDYGFADEVF